MADDHDWIKLLRQIQSGKFHNLIAAPLGRFFANKEEPKSLGDRKFSSGFPWMQHPGKKVGRDAQFAPRQDKDGSERGVQVLHPPKLKG